MGFSGMVRSNQSVAYDLIEVVAVECFSVAEAGSHAFDVLGQVPGLGNQQADVVLFRA